MLEFSQNQELPKTFDVWNQFAWVRDPPAATYVAAVQSERPTDHESTVSNLLNDINSENGPDANTPIKLYWTSTPELPGGNARRYDFSVIWEDSTNVVFIVKDLRGTGKSWDDVRRYIGELATIARQPSLHMNGRLDNEALLRTIPEIIRLRNAADGAHVETLEIAARRLIALLRPAAAR